MIIINSKSYKTYKFDEINKSKYVGFVYITINKLDGKKYVGQHSAWINWYLGSGKYLQNAIKKYGRENFERHIIHLAKTQKELDELESFYINSEFGENIAKSQDWYNIKDGSQKGGNSLTGLSKEECEIRGRKISESQLKKLAIFKDDLLEGEFNSVTEAIEYFGGNSRKGHEARAISKMLKGYIYKKGKFKGYSVVLKSVIRTNSRYAS